MISAEGEFGHIQYFQDCPASFGTVGNYEYRFTVLVAIIKCSLVPGYSHDFTQNIMRKSGYEAINVIILGWLISPLYIYGYSE